MVMQNYLAGLAGSVSRSLAAAGAPPVVTIGALPSIDTGLPALEFCRAVANAIPAHKVFLLVGKLVTIDIEHATHADGSPYKRPKVAELSVHRFCSWVEKYVRFYKINKDGEEEVVSLGDAKAKILLASDDMQRIAHPVDEIVEIRLPKVSVVEGKAKVTLLDEGYDAESRVYCCDTLGFAGETVPPALAKRALASVFREFPWFEERGNVWENRSFLAAFAIMLGRFFRLRIRRQPMYVVWGNQPGTGKSFLVKMLLQPFQADVVSETPMPSAAEEMRKELNALALYGATYAFLDDIPSLNNNTVNMYATSSTITCRELGTSRTLKIANKMQMICTGNQISISPDIQRRALISDLHLATDATERQIETHLSESSIAAIPYRRDLVKMVWSLCQPWIEAGCPLDVKDSDKFKSFGDFAQVVCGVLRAAGCPTPWDTARLNIDGGDEVGAAVKKLLIEASSRCDGPGAHPWTVSQLVELATELGLDDRLVTGNHDPNKSIGRKLKKFKGRKMGDTRGRVFTFGQKDSASGSVYSIIL